MNGRLEVEMVFIIMEMFGNVTRTLFGRLH